MENDSHNIIQKEAEKIVIRRFKKEGKSALTFKELALALDESPKETKRKLNKMVSDGLLKWYHIDTTYYEILS